MVPIPIRALYPVYNDGQAATNLLDFVPHSAVGRPAMTVKIDSIEPNIFPDVEDLDVRDGGRTSAHRFFFCRHQKFTFKTPCTEPGCI
jgi:hypothetical protein